MYHHVLETELPGSSESEPLSLTLAELAIVTVVKSTELVLLEAVVVSKVTVELTAIMVAKFTEMVLLGAHDVMLLATTTIN
jgi:hypothetical protein